jgi:hypothetical protein
MTESENFDKITAHKNALQWSHMLVVQVDRLRLARVEALASTRAVETRHTYTHEQAKPFHRLESEVFFCMIAARQLQRALMAFDGDYRLPKALDGKRVKLLRDALEHWDAEGGSWSEAELRKLGGEPRAHQWIGDGGAGTLGDSVEDEALHQWGLAVYEEMSGTSA